MKKFLMLIFIGLIIAVTIFVYESFRNPVIRVILPDNHNLEEGAPLIFEDITIGSIAGIDTETIGDPGDIERDTAKIRLKGDIYYLICEEDTFYVKDGSIYVEKAEDRKTPISKGHIIESTLYKSVYQYIVVGIDDIKNTISETVRNESSKIFSDGIDQIKSLISRQTENNKLNEKLNSLNEKLKEFSRNTKEELIARKTEILAYINDQIGELRDLDGDDAVRVLENLKKDISGLPDENPDQKDQEMNDNSE